MAITSWTANAYTHNSVDYVNCRFNSDTTLVIAGEGVGDILMIGGGDGGYYTTQVSI